MSPSRLATAWRCERPLDLQPPGGAEGSRPTAMLPPRPLGASREVQLCVLLSEPGLQLLQEGGLLGGEAVGVGWGRQEPGLGDVCALGGR